VDAPTEIRRQTTADREHRVCFVRRPAADGGLGLDFHVADDGAVGAHWSCPPEVCGYDGVVHGGLVATALDGAMTNALFARGVVARTGELRVRFHAEVKAGLAATVRAWLVDARPPLHRLASEVRQNGQVCARATAKFMTVSGARRIRDEAREDVV
jgi:acyl-coenzyme A thioesterase PaaI-like protein